MRANRPRQWNTLSPPRTFTGYLILDIKILLSDRRGQVLLGLPMGIKSKKLAEGHTAIQWMCAEENATITLIIKTKTYYHSSIMYDTVCLREMHFNFMS